jgi:hypothetical protein
MSLDLIVVYLFIGCLLSVPVVLAGALWRDR